MEKEGFSLRREINKHGKTVLFVLGALGILGYLAYDADSRMGTFPREPDQTKEVMPLPMGLFRW